MKIKIMVAALTILTATQGFAQVKDNSVYIKFYGGLTVFTPGSDQIFMSPGYIYTPQTNGVVPLNSNGRYGSGLNMGAEIQKGFGDMLIAGLTINYLSGKQLTADGVLLPDNTITGPYDQIGKLSIWTAIPNISFKIFSKPGYYIYTKLGVIVAFDSQYSSSGQTTVTNFLQTDIYTDQYKFGLNAGVQAAAGVQFKLTRRIKAFIEITNNFLSVSPNSFTYQQHRYGGSNNVLTNIDNKDVTLIKSTSGNEKTSSNTSTTAGGVTTTNSAYSQPAIYQHANNVVLNIGIAVPIK